MELIDGIDNINDLLIALKAKLIEEKFNKNLLIREAFTLWYTLVEGEDCENFSDDEIENLLQNNFKTYQVHFSEDNDYTFIVGWMVSITFWYFGSSIKEEYGSSLLIKAYQSNPKNSLFKWAIRDKLRLTNDDLNHLKIDISVRFEQFYDYGVLIREYFLDVINTPH